MNLASSFKILFASLALTSFALTGCAADTSAADEDGSEDVEIGSDELSARSTQFVGDFAWSATKSGAFTDFQHLSLRTDGTYEASVASSLVDPKIVCITFPCTAGESGTWTTVKSGGQLKVKVSPTGKPSRSYYASIANDVLPLKRFGTTTKLFREAAPVATCAATLCAVGTTCVDGPTGAKCVPVTPPPAGGCVKTGCSGQICADGERFSTCEFRPEYACYASATCARQADGKCGWTTTPALSACLASHL